MSALTAGTLSILMFLMFDKFRGRSITNLYLTIILFVVTYLITLAFILNTPKVYVRKRQREIDKEVLFAGRYLLVKMQSGVPFFNALTEASKSYGVSGKYFHEIVHEINIGTPIEKALEKAVEYNASEKFKMILWQVLNSLKTGVDTTSTLKSTLSEIAKDQMLDIKKYGKKLNSLAVFYMLIGIVVPSLGMAIFIIVTSLLTIEIGLSHLSLVLLLLAFMQFMFISMFRTIRPNISL